MVDKPGRARPVPDRARKRAIRAQAARQGVPYSVAARQLGADPGAQAGAGMPASQGRTIYPTGTDTHRQWLVTCRERRSAAQRVQDARLAADLPDGRPRHLAERFPPTRGEPGTGVGPLYHGAGRCLVLSALYLLVAHERPDLVPTTGELAWEAELGEETSVDTACTRMDRAARRLLDGDRPALQRRIEALARDDRPAIRPDRVDFEGAAQVLDAVLVVGEDGHAPGTRVRMAARRGETGTHGADEGGLATIVGAFWDESGPPVRYQVRADRATRPTVLLPGELWLPAPHSN